MPTVTIGGVEPDQVLNVRAETRSEADLGEAHIDLVDTDSNRTTFGPGDSITIDWGNGIDWEGEVVGRPSESNGVLTYRGLGESLPLKHEQAFRVFYETESSEAVKDLATEQVEQLGRVNVHVGDDPSNWTSQAPIAEAYAGDRASLYDYGTDLLVLGARGGHAGELRTTYTNVTSDAIADGIFALQTRLIIPKVVADYWRLIVELKTPSGTSYRWEPALQPGGTTYELNAEDATPDDSGLNNGELRYRLLPSGVVSQLTLVGIDHAATTPFATSARSSAPGTGDVESSGRTITRRVSGSVGGAIDDLATEDDAEWYVDGGTLAYLPGGDDGTTASGLSITEGTTPVTAVDADRDYEGIRNRVVVQGADDIEVTVSNQASIDFYGSLPRDEPIVDPSLNSEGAARDRAEGFLADAAFDDASVTFTIADTDFAQLRGGERIDVTWSPEGLDGTYTVDSVEAQSSGLVDVTISVSTAYN